MGLLHGEASWEGGDGLSGIAADIYRGYDEGRDRISSLLRLGGLSEAEKKRIQAKFDESVSIAQELNEVQQFWLHDGNLVPFTVAGPVLLDNGACVRETKVMKDFIIFGEIVYQCQRVRIEGDGDDDFVYRVNDSGPEAPWRKKKDMFVFLLRAECEGEKARIRIWSREDMQDVRIGTEKFSVPCFVSSSHLDPKRACRFWALLNDICYPLSFGEEAYELDEEIASISLDDLYSF